MKKVLLGILGVLLFVSCSSDDKNEKTVIENKNGANNEFIYKYSSEDEKKELIDKINSDFLIQLFEKDKFNGDSQVAGVLMEDDKVNKILKLKYDIVDIDYSVSNFNLEVGAIGLGLMSNSKDQIGIDDGDKTEVAGYRLKHTCNGGKNNGKSITLDRPTVLTAAGYAKAVGKFTNACFDGDGTCITVCKVNMVLTRDLADIDIEKINLSEEQLLAFIKLLENAENAALNNLK